MIGYCQRSEDGSYEWIIPKDSPLYAEGFAAWAKWIQERKKEEGNE